MSVGTREKKLMREVPYISPKDNAAISFTSEVKSLMDINFACSFLHATVDRARTLTVLMIDEDHFDPKG